jgi:hypothetical protein
MKSLSTLLLLLVTSTALAEIVSRAENGFSLVNEATLEVPRSEAWDAAVSRIGRWWSSDHTVSGNAGNMSIDARPLGCFCEAIGEHGGVVHLTVTFVNPAVMLRMTGGLGPLGLMGVTGNMLWEFFDAAEGTRVRFSYAVGGHSADGLDGIAPAVDYVIGEALDRLVAYAETGDPDAGRP